jgi:hypothetical protein
MAPTTRPIRTPKVAGQDVHVAWDAVRDGIAGRGRIRTGLEVHEPQIDLAGAARREEAQEVQVAGDQAGVDPEGGAEPEQSHHLHLAGADLG